jgi:hypothetical protein
MPNMTLSIPEEIHSVIKKHNEIRWSEIARRAITQEAMKLNLMDRIASKSKLTMKDVKEIDEKIKEGIFKRYN